MIAYINIQCCAQRAYKYFEKSINFELFVIENLNFSSKKHMFGGFLENPAATKFTAFYVKLLKKSSIRRKIPFFFEKFRQNEINFKLLT